MTRLHGFPYLKPSSVLSYEIRESSCGAKIFDLLSFQGLANVLRDVLARTDDARELLRALYQHDAALIPHDQTQPLTVRLHHLATRMSSAALQHLCDQLTATATVFPGTNLRLVYTLVSHHRVPEIRRSGAPGKPGRGGNRVGDRC